MAELVIAVIITGVSALLFGYWVRQVWLLLIPRAGSAVTNDNPESMPATTLLASKSDQRNAVLNKSR
jgi:hypothetical protein